jgi:transposase-like protein
MAMSKKAESDHPLTQVEPRATRRSYSIEFKRSIVEKAAACSEPGEIGKLLRSHGLYSSHLVDWRRQHEAGNLKGYGRLRRGPIAKDPVLAAAACEQQRRIEQLERENQRLRLRAVKAEALVEFQKKAACLLAAEVIEVRDDVC